MSERDPLSGGSGNGRGEPGRADPSTSGRVEDPEGLPSRIGPYRILERLGEGGIGVVYLADQEQPVRRRVALKMIKPGMDIREILTRFEQEIQILALLNHENIVRLYEPRATEEGNPYFTMEYVPGVPITEFCDRNQLTVWERLAIFRQVCAGVQHFHEKGIVHRSLAPSNILVTGDVGAPRVKILDFCVAKVTSGQLTERKIITEYGRIIGIPEYMPPEQAEGDSRSIDTRADIYALGVMLFELLAGAGPYDSRKLRAGSLTEMRKAIRSGAATAMSSRVTSTGRESQEIADLRGSTPERLVLSLLGDLDAIVRKAMARDRTHRYPCAAELSEDIQRYLDGRPVAAVPPTFTYRFSKFLHRIGVARLAALAIGGGFLFALGWLAARFFG